LTGDWLVPFGSSGARPTLVCLPQAGSGCGVFRSWQHVLGDDVSVVGVALPGRESRFADAPVESVAVAVREIVAELVALVPPGTPTVLFGHSLGGLLGYEVARALPADRVPAALVVAASRPPHLSGRAAGGMADDDSSDVLVKLLAAKELDDDVRELIMAVLEQDAELSATYEDPDGAPAPCPLHAWGGDTDEVVTPAHVAGWRPYAGSTFHSRQFAGGHDFAVASAAVPAALSVLVSPSRQRGVTCTSTSRTRVCSSGTSSARCSVGCGRTSPCTGTTSRTGPASGC